MRAVLCQLHALLYYLPLCVWPFCFLRCPPSCVSSCLFRNPCGLICYDNLILMAFLTIYLMVNSSKLGLCLLIFIFLLPTSRAEPKAWWVAFVDRWIGFYMNSVVKLTDLCCFLLKYKLAFKALLFVKYSIVKIIGSQNNLFFGSLSSMKAKALFNLHPEL